MKLYKHRVKKLVSFDAPELAGYEKAAKAAQVDFSQWVNAQCSRAVKRDARQPNNRVRSDAKGE